MHYTFIMANRPKGTLYIGESDDLLTAITLHASGNLKGLAPKHKACTQLMWFESHDTRESAIARQAELLAANRSWVIKRLRILNPKWTDLAPDLTADDLSDPARVFPSDSALNG